MQEILQLAKEQALTWLGEYGDFAVVPALLADPGGVPWLWIFVMLLAEKAGKNIIYLLCFGMVVTNVFDHLSYWIGYLGGRPLLQKVSGRFPSFAQAIAEAEQSVRGKGIWAIIIGRFLPIIGRWAGLAAGLVHVPYTRFTLFNTIGSALTVIGFGVAAHMIGEKTIDKPWFPAALGIAFIGGIGLSIVTIILQVIMSQRKKHLQKKQSIQAKSHNNPSVGVHSPTAQNPAALLTEE
jgi:membrane protein DedA with SNARE-associated domain